MRTPITIVFAVCAVSAALADDAKPVHVTEHPELRALLGTDYHFVAKPKAKAVPAPVWSTHATMADMPPPAFEGPKVVKMAPMIVRGDRAVRAMDAAVRAQVARARVEQSYRRLGIGVHPLRLWKTHLPIYVVTVFDIPISIGISW